MKRRNPGKQTTVRKKRKSKPARRSMRGAPQTLAQYRAMTVLAQETWNSVGHVITEMKQHKTSLQDASKKFGIDSHMVARWGRSALKKHKNGRYTVKAKYRLLRVVRALTTEGVREIAVNDSRQATRIAEHWNAAHRYLETGDDSALQRFFRNNVVTDASGEKVSLLTDLEEIERLGSAGELSFESLYARGA